MYPLFIPSKGRSQTCIFCHKLKSTNREFYIFIYREDLKDYLRYFDKEKSDSCSRNYTRYYRQKTIYAGHSQEKNRVVLDGRR